MTPADFIKEARSLKAKKQYHLAELFDRFATECQHWPIQQGIIPMSAFPIYDQSTGKEI